MPLRDDILNPIPGDNPSGADLRYDPVYAKIKEARREEDDVPQGEWVIERKVADWNQVLKLAGDAVATRSKDLQLAAWLTEALIRKEGFPGLRQGLELVKGLLDNFWDTLYPLVEEGDAEMRAIPLDWIGSRLDQPLRQVGLTREGYDWFQYKESRAIPTEDEAGKDEKKAELRSAKLADGKISPEQFDKSFESTSKAFYAGLVEEQDACLELLDSLTQLCEQKFGDATPSFSPLKATIEEVRHTANLFLQKKRELEPDAAPAAEAAAGAAAGETGAAPALSFAGMGLPYHAGPAAAEAVFQMAQQAARAGRLPEAIRLLTDQLAADASARGRFIRRTQIAQICLESGQDGIAMPILEELAAEIDKRNLEEWEFGEVLARPLALLYKCMVRQDRDHEERMKLYARVCRLNPFEALTVAR
jgi:type VI secretion system protein ImpA